MSDSDPADQAAERDDSAPQLLPSQARQAVQVSLVRRGNGGDGGGLVK